jgi:hypothetical protein
LVELAVDVVLRRTQRGQVLERASCLQLLDRRRPRLRLVGLVDRALHRCADVGHLVPHAGGRLGDVHLRLSRRVLRLDDLLL